MDAPRQEGRPSVPGPAWSTHQSGGAGKLGAEHLTLLGAARLEDLGDRRRGLLSRFLSEEAKRLKVKRPPRACPLSPTHPQVPRGSRARRQLGPRAQRGASRMNGSLWALLCPRQAVLLRPRLTVPRGGGGSDGGRGRRSGAGRAGAVRLLFAPGHPDGKGGESGTVGKTLKVTL